MKLKLEYYAVFWGETKRWTGDKVASPLEAMRKCFGMVANNMQVISLGTQKKEALKKLRELEAK